VASAVSASRKASRNSFYHPALSYLCFIGIAISWLVPDRRIASMSREMRKQLGVLGYMKIVLMVLKRWGIGGLARVWSQRKFPEANIWDTRNYRRTQTLTVPRIRRTSECVVTSIRVSNDSQ